MRFFGQADLSNCERELIHLAGSVQPHGVLLVLQVERLQQQQEFLCEEVSLPIPDEFETATLRADWMVAGNAVVLNEAAMASYLQLQIPAASLIAQAGMIGQTVIAAA